MPFEHIGKYGNYEGIIADYMALFSKKTGIPFELVPTKDYHQSRLFLKNGKCDIIAAEQATKEIRKVFLVTQPYFFSPRAFVTDTDARLVLDFSQIAHSGKVGVLKDSPAQVILPQLYPGIDLQVLDNGDAGVRRVASGDLVAFVNILPALVYSLQKQGLTNVKISGTLPSKVALSVLINPSRPELLPLLNDAIDHITQSERQKILSKWVQVKYEKGVDYSLLWKLSALFGVIILLLGLRYYHLSRLRSKLEAMHERLSAQMMQEIQKNQQHQLMILQQNRLAQKGEMISMIAHQWRQPLNTLSILTQNFLIKLRSGNADEASIEDFSTTSRRLIRQMSETIDDFRNFFKSDKERRRFSVNDVTAHALSILKPLLDDNGISVVVTEKDRCMSEGFPNELGQAIINILNNAQDALIENEVAEKEIRLRIEKMGREVVIEICDNAGGIDEEILPQIFDPYFSTKSQRHGTGLGLYMSRMIIEEHMGGRLEVSNGEKGACFRIVLPRVLPAGNGKPE